MPASPGPSTPGSLKWLAKLRVMLVVGVSGGIAISERRYDTNLSGPFGTRAQGGLGSIEPRCGVWTSKEERAAVGGLTISTSEAAQPRLVRGG
jgi:hypothetical protein